MDATVSWGGPDFKFKNSTDYPIKICAWRKGQTVTVELWGTKSDDTYVKMSYEINERHPCGAAYTEDASVPKGSRKVVDPGRAGMKVTTYRCVYGPDGSLLSRKLEAVTYYSARDADIHVAPGEKPE
jgi:vancomycin resistance protein YoaR